MKKPTQSNLWNNLSNGKSNGFVLFYMKDGMLHPVLLTKEQADLLDLSIILPFQEKPCTVALTPLEYDAIKEMIIK